MWDELKQGLSKVAQTPNFLLKMGEKDITQTIRERLIGMTLTDNRGIEVDELTIVLDDADGKVEMPARGVVLSLSLGWSGSALVEKGIFTVDTVEHTGAPDTLKLVARSVDLSGALNASKEESWHDMKLGAIVETIAARHKLIARVAPELANIDVKHVDQSQESEAVFLNRLAKLNGGEVTMKAGTLLFQIPGKGVTGSGKPIPAVTIARSDGDTHLFSIADRTAYVGVTAKWQDTKDPKQQKQKMEAGPKSAVPPKDEGKEYLYGKRGNVFAIPTIYATKEQAARAAKAKWNEIQREKVEFKLNLAIGREELCPETPVTVQGFKNVIDEQQWFISKLVHTIDEHGFTTTLTLEVKVADAEVTQVEK